MSGMKAPPKCILTGRFVGYTGEDRNITLTSEEDTRLCRLANENLDEDNDVSENRTTPEDEI